MTTISFALRAAAFSAVLALLVVAFSPRTEEVDAGHLDWGVLNPPPNLWLNFFESAAGDHDVKWQICDFMPIFGFTPNAVSAITDWENTHGYGIDFRQTGSCSGGSGVTFRSLFGNECNAPPWIFVLGCWLPTASVTYSGFPAAIQAKIYYNTLWYDAMATSAQKTHNFAHELGHGMAVAHHAPECAGATTVMSQGMCTDEVEPPDVFWPRCLYGYTC